MVLAGEISEILDAGEEPLCKRLKFADNAFKSSELQPQCKPLLLKWILKNSHKDNEDTWQFLNDWLSSHHFQNLSRNEIDNKEITAFVELFIERLGSFDEVDENVMSTVIATTLLLLENRAFQQYFTNKIEQYFHLILCILDKIKCPIKFANFIKNNSLFFKNLILSKEFLTHFFGIILPTVVKYLVRFSHKDVFLQVSKLLQKCIFYNNHKSYVNFMNNFFTEVDNNDHPGPKTLLQHLMKTYTSDKGLAKEHYKLIFHAFSTAYDNDFQLVYKFLVVLMYSLGFKLSPELILRDVSIFELPELKISSQQSQECLLEVLQVLVECKTDLSCNIKDVTFSDFLKYVLENLVFSNRPSVTNYKIIIEVIKIDPLIIQAVTDKVIIYSMLADNSDCSEAYEELIISMLNIYSKLHRVENLVSKMLTTLSAVFSGTYDGKNVYFCGEGVEKDSLKENYSCLKCEDIFSENILLTFSKSIGSLASWQIINVFKTLLYSLKGALEKLGDFKNDDEINGIYMQILSNLISNFLSSIRIAEHTVASNVIEKTRKCLEELSELLQLFGSRLLNREHNHILMRSFLNIAYHWAEISMTMRYYSTSQEDVIDKVPESDYSPCNLTFLHPYLTTEEWCLISERIKNFGEPPCKLLMYKLFIQRVRALHIFGEKVNSEIINNLLRNITTDLDFLWKYILDDRFSIKILIPNMDTRTLIMLVEKFVNEYQTCVDFQKYQHMLNSSSILNALIYVVVMKINKLVTKQKRKLGEENVKKKLSSRICSIFTEDFFTSSEDGQNFLTSATKVYSDAESDVNNDTEWKVKEDKLLDLFGILKVFPVIHSSESIKKMYILYFCSLHKDLSSEFLKGNYRNLQSAIENNIIGVLQQCKFKLGDIFDIDTFCLDILNTFMCWDETFSLVIDNIFKNKESIVSCESLVTKISHQLTNPIYMQCSIILINAVNKLKKTKMPKETKNIAENYKTLLCDKILKLVSKNEPTDCLLAGYAYSLKHYLSQNDEEKTSKLLNILDTYIQYALKSKNDIGNQGYLTLFITVLQNKSKIKTIQEDFPLDVWNVYSKDDAVYSSYEEYSQLILLIVGHIPNEHFSTLTTDLLNISNNVFTKRDLSLVQKVFKTWEAVLSSNINSTKLTILQSAIEELLYQIIQLLESHQNKKEIIENVLNIEKIIIQANHLHLTPAIMDVLLLNVTILMNNTDEDFPLICNLSTSLLSNLLKYRKPLVMDRLPPFLQQYRIILQNLCKKSNSDLNADESYIKQISDSAHQLEKLTKSLVVFQKDMGRIAMYLIADILEQYEQVTLFTNVKIHLNNCIYCLISICDQHAISFLMRVLSNASTEIFKIMYENYKKYYRFTGKV